MPTLWDRMSETERNAKVAEVVMEWEIDGDETCCFRVEGKDVTGEVIAETVNLLSWPGEGFSLIVEAMRKRGFRLYHYIELIDGYKHVGLRKEKQTYFGGSNNDAYAAAIAALIALGEGKLFEEMV